MERRGTPPMVHTKMKPTACSIGNSISIDPPHIVAFREKILSTAGLSMTIDRGIFSERIARQ
jgi:hypothetical protein